MNQGQQMLPSIPSSNGMTKLQPKNTANIKRVASYALFMSFVTLNLRQNPATSHIASESSYLPAEIVVRNIDLYGEAQREAIDRINQALYSLDQLIRMAAAQNKNDSEIQQARELLIRAQTAMENRLCD
jgi:hypothetical protein